MSVTAKTKTADEGRRAPRKTTRTLGYIVGEKIHDPIECTILDLSASGAKLKLGTVTKKNAFAAVVELPDTFKIELPRDKLVIECKLAWQTEEMVGVSFQSPFRPMVVARRR